MYFSSVRLSLCHCEKYASSTKYSEDVLEPKTNTSGESSGRGSSSSFECREEDVAELSDNTKSRIRNYVERSLQLKKQSENLLAVSEAEVETSRISKDITLLNTILRGVRDIQATNLVRAATTEIKTALTSPL